MTNRSATAINIVAAVVMTAYLVVAIIYYDSRRHENICKDIVVEVADASPYRFVTDSIVRVWLSELGVPIIGSMMEPAEVYQIEQALKEHKFVDSVEVYATMQGSLNIMIMQNIPVLRIKSDNGYDFYVDSTIKILPMQHHFRADVPILSGELNFDFDSAYYGELDAEKYDKDRIYIKKIINFVRYIAQDKFLSNFIVQIYVNGDGDIELIPRIGEQIIILGTLDEYDVKLDKLRKFYHNSFSEQWWKGAKIVNLKYSGQVIVS